MLILSEPLYIQKPITNLYFILIELLSICQKYTYNHQQIRILM